MGSGSETNKANKNPQPQTKNTHGSALRRPEFKKKNEMEEIKKTEANAEWFSSWINWPYYCMMESSGNRVQYKLLLDPLAHTHRHAHRPHPELLYCVFILICNEDKIIYTCTPFKCARSVTMNKRDGVTLWEHRHLSLRVCVGRMNLPLSQQGLNTHRVNIIGLNPGWVDIGLVWVQDFIFLSLTLVFAVSDLNSIGVICLSKARTGTCRSWVGAHCDQGNSIRQHPYSVCGWDSSVDIGGLGLGDSTSGECTISRERVHNGWWEAPQMNAFKNALSAHPGNRSKPYSKGFISSCGSSLYQMASVSSTAPQVSKASFYETNNVLFRRPIYLSYMKEVQTSS